MRQATLYTIKAERVMAGDFMEFRHVISDPRDICRVHREPDTALACIETKKIPVDMVSRIRDGERQDQYIALHPDLREILEAPILRPLHEARYELGNAMRRISDFKALPWYKRVWKAVRGEI